VNDEAVQFFNSSASYRVRIALALKGHRLPERGRQYPHRSAERAGVPAAESGGLVPTLITDDGESLGQSLAIADWLDRHYPQPPLLPAGLPARSKVLEIVYAIACDIHPINNMRVLRYLSDELKVSEEEKKRWYAHWIQQGSAPSSSYCATRNPAILRGRCATLADCCLVPQWANALRMGCDLSHYPRCQAVYDACTRLPAFIAAAPENQQDKIPA
jgi:maleylpyruvate isomerase